MTDKHILTSRQWMIIIISYIVLFWGFGLISFATYTMFVDPSIITGAANTAYTALLGIISILTGFVTKKVTEFYGRR